MITTRAVLALLPSHHRHVAVSPITLKDFADSLETSLCQANSIEIRVTFDEAATLDVVRPKLRKSSE